MLKTIIFFIVTLLLLLYIETFWINRREKVKLHFLRHKIDINLGGLMLAVFLDGLIFALILLWLLNKLSL